MVQLEVEGIFIDLYDTDPIRLNFNIEDIVDVTIQSEYSRQFRVPNTAHNSELFKTLFDVEGYDFDVTQKRDASILVNGAEFRRGEVRLLNIYRNDKENGVDYEIVFLGSTKNLGSKLGNKTINDLDYNNYQHDIDYTNITASWQAFPEGGLTDGLFNGDIIYPLVDFGNTYDSNGVVEQTRVAIGDGTGRHINNSSWPVTSERFRPMMRAKAILDLIFEEAGYTYDSSFFNSNEFKQIYLSGWGNETEVDINTSTTNLAGWGQDQFGQFTYAPEDGDTSQVTVPYDTIFYDYGSNVSNGAYSTPVNGDYVAKSFLNVSCESFSTATIFNINPYQFFDGGAIASQVTYSAQFISGGTQAQITRIEIGQPNQVFVVDVTVILLPNGIYRQFNFTIIDELAFSTAFWPSAATFAEPRLQITTGVNAAINVYGGYMQITEAEGGFIPIFSFGNEYKQLDFLKDLFTMFRLVLVPDVSNPNNFKIEPWSFYIASGTIKDWSPKIDLSKDKVIKPIVLEQKDRLYYQMEEDKDWLNSVNLDEFKEPFGTQIVNSGYEVLDSEKTYEVKIAPTPFTQIQGYTANVTDWENVIIPQICTQEATDNGIQFKPIASKQRLLYYNGLQSSGTWYIEDESSVAQAKTSVPIVSYYSQWPPNPNAKILNFQKENGYDQENVFNADYGQDLYTRYWSSYNNLVYDKWSRRLTAYFNLDAQDLIEFNYSDVIYIEGAYYYVERINDAPLEGKNTVKVDLVKLINYSPNVGNFVPPVDLNIWNEFDEVWNTTTASWND